MGGRRRVTKKGGEKIREGDGGEMRKKRRSNLPTRRGRSKRGGDVGRGQKSSRNGWRIHRQVAWRLIWRCRRRPWRSKGRRHPWSGRRLRRQRPDRLDFRIQ